MVPANLSYFTLANGILGDSLKKDLPFIIQVGLSLLGMRHQNASGMAPVS